MAKKVYIDPSCPINVTLASDPSNPIYVSNIWKDFDTKTYCEIDGTWEKTGVEVIIIIAIDEQTLEPMISYYNLLDGTPRTWTASQLVKCDGSLIESDNIPFCDNWEQFIRWFVKEDGQPTWVVFDTKLDGTSHTASGSETQWECPATQVDEVITITGTETFVWTWAPQTLTSPANTKYAIGQVLSGSIVLTVDGSNPVEWTNGYIEANKFILETEEEINNFIAIWSAMTGNTATVYITYYDWVIDTGWF